jgi:ectoine hydroxylase-related dioxygenase (phytanoyl-CoA dioxygenase family)
MYAQQFHLSDEMIHRFEEDGVIHLKGVLDPETISRLGVGISTLVDHLDSSAAGYDLSAVAELAYAPHPSTWQSRASQHDVESIARAIRESGARRLADPVEPSAKRGRYTLDTTTWKRSKIVREIALDSVLPEVASGLLSCDRINYLDDQIFVKEPGTPDRTAFHQDYTYFHISGWKGCVMWICADPADNSSGVPCYVRGSHRWNVEFQANVFLAHIGFPGSVGADLSAVEDHPEQFDIVSFETKPGDVIVHHFRTVHGAGGNSSARPRRALSLRYCGDDIRFKTRPGAPRQPYHDHTLEDGHRLDSRQFPVVWPRPYPGFQLAPILGEQM